MIYKVISKHGISFVFVKILQTAKAKARKTEKNRNFLHISF